MNIIDFRSFLNMTCLERFEGTFGQYALFDVNRIGVSITQHVVGVG